MFGHSAKFRGQFPMVLGLITLVDFKEQRTMASAFTVAVDKNS
jgi:hypothetical protein